MLMAVPAVALAADLASDVNADISSNVLLPTEVSPNTNKTFQIKVWAVGNYNNINNTGRTGEVQVVKNYSTTLDTTTTPNQWKITPGTQAADKETINFETGLTDAGFNPSADNDFHYTNDCTTANFPNGLPKGCPGNPFIVNANLSVGNVPSGTQMTLTDDFGTLAPGFNETSSSVDSGYVKVVVSNHNPTVETDAGNVSGSEGSALSNNGAFADQDTNDTLTITKKSGLGTVTDNGDGTWSWSYTPADNGSGTVEVQASDGKPGSTAAVDTFTWTANNVAPTATFNSPDVAEGTNISLSLTSPSDPAGSNDTLSYAFDCGDGNGYVADSDGATTCSTNDNGTRSVKGKIMDEDGGSTEYTDTVAISNVAPTATFGNNGPVNEGSNINLSLTGAADASSVDTAAGFQYRFDCGTGSGYGSWGTDSSTSCPTTDNGTRSVKAEIKDKDGGSTEYTDTVTVNNVAPVLSALSLSGNTGTACLSGNTVDLSFSFSDVGTDDSHSGTINWGDGNTTPFTSSPQNVQHTYGAGTYTITVTVNDDDNGQDSDTASVSKLYSMSGILSPFNSDPLNYSVWKYGSTIPVKVQITDCNGVSVPGLAPKLGTSLANASTPAPSINEDVFSTSNADTGNVLRYSDGQYIYNFNSKSNAITDQNATYWMSVKGFDANNKVVTNPAQVDRKFGIKSK
jgi:hypothetical protein